MNFARDKLEAPVTPDGAHDVGRGRKATVGNICTMRIFIDRFLMKLFNSKKHARDYVKYFERKLNNIYNEAGVSVKVNNAWLPLKFKVVDLQFHDDDFCRRNDYSPGSRQY